MSQPEEPMVVPHGAFTDNVTYQEPNPTSGSVGMEGLSPAEQEEVMVEVLQIRALAGGAFTQFTTINQFLLAHDNGPITALVKLAAATVIPRPVNTSLQGSDLTQAEVIEILKDIRAIRAILDRNKNLYAKAAGTKIVREA